MLPVASVRRAFGFLDFVCFFTQKALLGLSPEEIAFYDALAENQSARQVMENRRCG